MVLDPRDLYALVSAAMALSVFTALVIVLGKVSRRRFRRRLRSVCERAQGAAEASTTAPPLDRATTEHDPQFRSDGPPMAAAS
jgi:hypothetical protein